MPETTPTGNILIVDGHGDLGIAQQTFDFRRSQGTRVNVHSYINEGTGIRTVPSNHLVAAAVGGQIPKGSTAVSSSQVDGVRARDRILYAEGMTQVDDGLWVIESNYEFPTDWDAKLVALRSIQGPWVEAVCWYNGAEPRLSNRVWLSLHAEGPDEPLRSVWLSTILAHFDSRPYDLLWMACRGDN